MPVPDDAACLISEGQLAGAMHRWQADVVDDERRYQLGTWLRSPEAHRACTASTTRKALDSPDKRAKREVADRVL